MKRGNADLRAWDETTIAMDGGTSHRFTRSNTMPNTNRTPTTRQIFGSTNKLIADASRFLARSRGGKYAYDEAPDDGPQMSAQECATVIKKMLMNLPPEESVRLMELMQSMVNSGDPQMAAEDDPADFSGMPSVGGGMDRGRRGQAHDRRMALDSRSIEAFNKRFPMAARIRHDM